LTFLMIMIMDNKEESLFLNLLYKGLGMVEELLITF